MAAFFLDRGIYMMDLYQLYRVLIGHYGPQGWWPVILSERDGFTDASGYHKDKPVFDANITEKYEIITGAVLTQNTSWNNVYKCINTLKEKKIVTPEIFLNTESDFIKALIKKSGYYNQKYTKLSKLLHFLILNDYLNRPESISRDALLEQWGIGEETADSILLYAFNKPYFVIDSYTRRLLKRIGNVFYKKYSEYQKYIINSIPKNIQIYNEYHALIVKHSVDVCRKKPLCSQCFLADRCEGRDI